MSLNCTFEYLNGRFIVSIQVSCSISLILNKVNTVNSKKFNCFFDSVNQDLGVKSRLKVTPFQIKIFFDSQQFSTQKTHPVQIDCKYKKKSRENSFGPCYNHKNHTGEILYAITFWLVGAKIFLKKNLNIAIFKPKYLPRTMVNDFKKHIFEILNISPNMAQQGFLWTFFDINSLSEQGVNRQLKS